MATTSKCGAVTCTMFWCMGFFCGRYFLAGWLGVGLALCSAYLVFDVTYRIICEGERRNL